MESFVGDNITQFLPDANFTCEGKQLLLRPFLYSTIGYYSRRYVFPFQFVIGVSTNFLNFVILSSKGMRTKTNNFLAAMALADLLFFLVYLPLQLSSYEMFSLSLGYTIFYFRSHIPLVASINWFSTASIWLTVGVTLERVIAVRFPLHARYYWKRSRVILAICAIFALSFLLNLYHYFVRSVVFERSKKFPAFCTYKFIVTDPEKHQAAATYVKVSTFAHNICAIIAPFVALIILNSVLLRFLRKNRRELSKFEEKTPSSERTRRQGSQDNASNVSHQRQEVKVTCTVALIILAFLIFNVPSGFVTTVELIVAGGFAKMPMQFYEITELSNVFVCTAKAVNFFLYCFCSSGFRKRLCAWLCELNKVLVKKVAYPTSRSLPASFHHAANGKNYVRIGSASTDVRLNNQAAAEKQRHSWDSAAVPAKRKTMPIAVAMHCDDLEVAKELLRKQTVIIKNNLNDAPPSDPAVKLDYPSA